MQTWHQPFVLGNFHASRESLKMLYGPIPLKAWNAEDQADQSGKDLSTGKKEETHFIFLNLPVLPHVKPTNPPLQNKTVTIQTNHHWCFQMP